uniref:Uncharacterized protein n=1 Tax=Caenorhabditis japonica TaxID=281687 RepID=A0A8R1IBR2_CAEJA
MFSLRNEMKTMEIFEASLKSIEIQENIKTHQIGISDFLLENYCDFVHISLARTDNAFSGWIVHDLEDVDEDEEDQERITVGDTVFQHL